MYQRGNVSSLPGQYVHTVYSKGCSPLVLSLQGLNGSLSSATQPNHPSKPIQTACYSSMVWLHISKLNFTQNINLDILHPCIYKSITLWNFTHINSLLFLLFILSRLLYPDSMNIFCPVFYRICLIACFRQCVYMSSPNKMIARQVNTNCQE